MNRRLLLLYFALALVVLIRLALYHPTPLVDGQHIDTNVRLLSSPTVSGARGQLIVKIHDQRVSLSVSRFNEYQYGDLLRVVGSLKARVLDDGRTVYSIYFPKITVVENDSGLPFHIAGFIRERLEDGFGRYLSSDQAGLLMGIVFGISGALDYDLKSQFQIAGVTHVIAASGMNVTLLAAFLLPIFLQLAKRRDALLLTLISLGLYAIISGLSASIVRAAIMGGIGLIGLMVGRQKTAFISFFLTGCIMILITPSVIADIGFQLSFMSTAGMLLIMPILPTAPSMPIVKLVKEDLAATLSAQIASMPLLLYYFHSLGLLSVVVNILVLWTIPPLMIIGSIAGVVAIVSAPLAGVVALLALPMLSYFMAVIHLFASISPVLQVESLPIALVMGYYLMLAAILVGLSKRKKKPGVGQGSHP